MIAASVDVIILCLCGLCDAVREGFNFACCFSRRVL